MKKAKPKLHINRRLEVLKYLPLYELGLACMLNKDDTYNHILTSKVVDAPRSMRVGLSYDNFSGEEYLPISFLLSGWNFLNYSEYDYKLFRRGFSTFLFRLVTETIFIELRDDLSSGRRFLLS